MLREAQAVAENYAYKLETLQEQLQDLEIALGDPGWQRISNKYDLEFSRSGLQQITKMARYYFLKNPLINRACGLQAVYVWGQGCTINVKDNPEAEAAIKAFESDHRNTAELVSQQARALQEIELQVTGNLFFVLFSPPTGSPDGVLQVRTLPFEEIQDIISNPEDSREPWYYRRTVKGEQVLYPDWRYLPENKPSEYDRIPIEWDHPIYHVKVGGFTHMRFGVSEMYSAIDWARAYKEFLEDWATIVRALSRFAWKMTVKGGNNRMQSIRTKLQTKVGLGTPETNPPPATGGMAMVAGIDPTTGQGVDLTPMPKSGATIAADDGRRLLLMLCAATGLPETFFGDVSVGTLATAKSLDRPTELKFKDRQTLWADVLEAIYRYMLDKQGVKLAEDETVSIDFPPLLEHDVDASVTAIVNAATLSGKADAGLFDKEDLLRLLLKALGEDDIDTFIANFKKVREQAEKQQLANEQQPQQPEAAVQAFQQALKDIGGILDELRGVAA